MIRILLICLCLAGCGGLVNDTASPTTPASTRDTIWTNIADAIEADQVENSTILELMVGHLRAMEKISDTEVSSLYALFPDIKKAERVLTKDDAEKIRGI